jgi:hypothetical protein
MPLDNLYLTHSLHLRLQTEVSYDYPRDAFLVAAGAAYVPGQQVFISYGAQNNDSLMQVGPRK